MEPKEAVEIALKYYNELFSGSSYTDVRLEELEKYPDSWKVTLGFLEDKANAFNLTSPKRSYKIFDINSNTGDIDSVKIRKVE